MTLHLMLILLYAASTLLHLMAIYFLYLTQEPRISKIERLFLMHLSIAELIISATVVARETCEVYEIEKCYILFMIPQWTGLQMMQFIFMICLTINRCLRIWLNITYAVYCTLNRAYIVVCLIWVFCFGVAIVSLVVIPHKRDEVIELSTLYFFPPLEIIFFVTAVLTYGYIFRQLRRNNRNRIQTGPAVVESKVAKNTKKNSYRGLLLPSLVILTFFIFMVVPDQTYFVANIGKFRLSEQLDKIFLVCYALSYIADALIYILLLGPVRGMVRKMMSQQIDTTFHHTPDSDK